MSVLELFETPVKPEKVADMKALLAEVLPDTRAFDGCQQFTVYFNTDDPGDMVFVGFWESVAHFERYAAWRTATKFGERFNPLLAGTPRKRFFEKADV